MIGGVLQTQDIQAPGDTPLSARMTEPACFMLHQLLHEWIAFPVSEVGKIERFAALRNRLLCSMRWMRRGDARQAHADREITLPFFDKRGECPPESSHHTSTRIAQTLITFIELKL